MNRLVVLLLLIAACGKPAGSEPVTPTAPSTTVTTSTTQPVTCWDQGWPIRTGSAEAEQLGC